MRISEVMHTPAVTCPASTTLGEVARTMRDRNVGSVLVVDQIGYLAGIVTDRDLAVRGMGAGLSADVTVDRVMTRDVATVSVHGDSSDAAGVMTKHMVRRVPVVDEQDRPHGVVTLDDLVRYLGTEADALADTIILQTARLPSQ